MTYANKGTEFPDDCARVGLSDAAYRTHDEAIVWVFRVEAMDLRIPKHLVRRFAGSADYELAIKELLALRFWRDRGDAYEIVHHAHVIRQRLGAQQSSRKRNRKSQQAHRARKKDTAGTPKGDTGVSAYVSDDVIPDAVCLPATKDGGAGGDKDPARAAANGAGKLTPLPPTGTDS